MHHANNLSNLLSILTPNIAILSWSHWTIGNILFEFKVCFLLMILSSWHGCWSQILIHRSSLRISVLIQPFSFIPVTKPATGTAYEAEQDWTRNVHNNRWNYDCSDSIFILPHRWCFCGNTDVIMNWPHCCVSCTLPSLVPRLPDLFMCATLKSWGGPENEAIFYLRQQ